MTLARAVTMGLGAVGRGSWRYVAEFLRLVRDDGVMGVSVPNDLLRMARLRVASRWDPGERGMTQRELAEAAADWVEQRYGERPGIDEKAIGRLERGETRRPGRRYREALRSVLGVSTDRELGFERPPVDPAATLSAPSSAAWSSLAGILDDVRRRDFLVGGTAALVGSQLLLPNLAGSTAVAAPARVGATEIEQVREALRVFGAWDYAYGGGFARAPATAHLRSVAGMLDARCPERLRGERGSVIARFADACAFMAFDDHAFTEAEELFRFALGCAEEADDWHVRAGVLTDSALMAIWVGQPKAAIALCERALAQPGRLTASERAMVWSTRARADAHLGDVQATLTAVGVADDEFGNSNPGEDPPRMSYYTEAEHAGCCGSALSDLTSVTGELQPAAITRQHEAVAGHSDEYARSRAHAQTQLAVVVMATGDPDEAAAIGTGALAATGPIRSRRSGEYLRMLYRVSEPYAARPVVEELRAGITDALAA